MVSPAPVSPYYPTPQSPGARSATPGAVAKVGQQGEVDTPMQQGGGPLSGEANARASSSANGQLHAEPVGSLPDADMQGLNGVKPEAVHALLTPTADAPAPPFPSSNSVKAEPEPVADLTTFAASAPNAPLANLDRKPSLSSMLTASASNLIRSPSPYKREGSTPSTNGDRKPSLPPLYPFASTSASVDEVDRKQVFSPVASGSGGSTPARSGSGSGEGDEEEEEVVKPGRGKGKGKKKKVEAEPQLIGHLPLAEEDAAKTYTELEGCTYYSKALGDVPYYDLDASRCDCSWNTSSREPDADEACGEHSNCVNRMMQIECLRGDCRFQKRQYAPIEIVQTEKKGFGVRAGADISADTFVYEYVGEVIGPQPFQRKMKEYANEGIKHFYFMALDRDVFIDATKKGGKGRFLNHSCNPNCVVAKWTVGRKMRMGIFTKRDIKMHEELTFNYNVDRYGHVAQECYCGERNCVGYIGGKTQTDLGGMDDLYIDALGITEEVEALGLKGSKKKKGKKLDEDFTPTLHPVQLEEVPKVSAAIRQALQTRRILEKLLHRVAMTTDDEVQRNLMRLHGLNLMNNVLREYPSDVHVITLDLEILSRWKLQTRNKIESSKIEENVQKCLAVEDDKVKTLAGDLLVAWGDLQLGYRIPKAMMTDDTEDPDRKRSSTFDLEQIAKRARIEHETSNNEEQRPRFVMPTANNNLNGRPPPYKGKLPDGWEPQWERQLDAYIFRNIHTGATQRDVPYQPARPLAQAPRYVAQLDANELIAQAERAAQEAKEAEERRVAEERAAREAEAREKEEQRKKEKEEKLRLQKDKRVMGLFSNVVVATMSKYKAHFDSETFKKRAREVTEILIEKEKKRPSYESESYDSIAPEKEAKVKSFVKDWVKKLVERRKSSSARLLSSSSSSLTPKRPDASDTPKPDSTPVDVDMPFSLPHTNGHSNGNGAPSGTPPGTPPLPRS
ncbi:histone-lysine N-methyltransferase SETD2 [Rhodotorula toruloides]|uniref:Histone-lysine N-methyltransferase, H3 lysine-36 specific n=1 Tax=Rhodotorula toruloides TaxID=5286 RepID=A0A511KNG3_RHOTO|nr:histone-lysine N-methyltransferase SETD2 [Rhodotorula toruloides]